MTGGDAVSGATRDGDAFCPGLGAGADDCPGLGSITAVDVAGGVGVVTRGGVALCPGLGRAIATGAWASTCWASAR